MKITELLLAELDREAVGIRNTLERVREGKMTGNRMRFTAAHFLGAASIVPVIGSFQKTTWGRRWLV